ncbi:MAG TPA: trigger factor [Flavobacteriaceae bacterium]|nr:trigger factor [Flavobacteriaceae bacterium]HEX5742492.1 trigger factor [Flavobacteriaceae bacterium]
MNITKQSIDALNAVIKIEIAGADYQEKVEKGLKDYRKKANIPGFRSGQIPMGLIKKQFGKALLAEEINKLIQNTLNQYLIDEKLDILGNPLPKEQADFSWDNEDFTFEFEIGLAPKFEIDLAAKNSIIHYQIEADEKMINSEIDSVLSRYGKMSSLDEVSEEATVTGKFVNVEKEIEKTSTINMSDIKGKVNLKKFLGNKVGDVVELKTKGLFEDEHKLGYVLGVKHEEVHGLDIDVTLTIETITKLEKAELNQELFDKMFGEGTISSADELKARIKKDAELQFTSHADQQLLNDVTEFLIANTKFDLPKEFLIKWLETAGEKPMTTEEATAEYDRSEKGLRYQLIEGKLITDNKIQVSFDDLKNFTIELIKAQMAQYGQMNPSEKEMDEIAYKVLTNEEERKRLSAQMMSTKLLDFFKENLKLKTKKVSYDDFVKEVYK